MTDLAPLRFWLESLIRPIIREVLTDELADLRPSDPHSPSTGKMYLNATQAADFLGIKLQTLYQNIEKIPKIKKHGKLFFVESELIAYMEGGREI